MTSDPGPGVGADPAHTQDDAAALTKAGPPTADASAEPARGARRRTHRPWSVRRIPAALTALVLAAATGTALVDAVAVRAGHHATVWRSTLAHELASRPVDDVWMLTGAAVAAALGLALVVLALAPGLRHALPLRPPANCPPRQLWATLDRDGAAVLLRDAAMRVPGVSRARVRVRRHRITALADVRFRDPHQVHDDLVALLREERDRLALVPSPRLAVRVRQRAT
ncbi:DUF6286 domain-containing protein [Streptomyces sp. Ru72]|uniref:DUF6286 domain-containing protein n=1 Tax=Streptomyces sp. Ru72 TaxID=2080747 RepID=UPI001C7189BB|nr:DUF6286 domain-containing protein [Streptomyces sp. Ru72]